MKNKSLIVFYTLPLLTVALHLNACSAKNYAEAGPSNSPPKATTPVQSGAQPLSSVFGQAVECTTEGQLACLTSAAFPPVSKEKATSIPIDCKSDGEVACVSTPAFAAAATTGLASKVLSGQTVAGIAGNITLPGAAVVRSSTRFGVLGGTSGTLIDCAADGGINCVATASFKAVDMGLLVPANIKNGVTIAGQVGNYPSVTSPLPGASVTTDLTSLASSTAAGSYEFWDSAGTRYTGSITDAGTITPTTSNQTLSTSLYRTFTVAGDANLVAGKILTGNSIFGVAGNVTLPSAANVRSSATFGVSGGTSGTLADCSLDGGTNCVVPSSGTIKAAETANFTGWDIRKTRNSSGTVLTFAGLTSQGKSHCRNQARLLVFDYTTAPGITGLDFFDTIDDGNNNVVGLPGSVPAWTMLIGGSTVTVTNDYKCGGIYATGSTATGNTGADATVAHDPDGNWQDLTPGILPGGANSTNTADGCNATDKHCVYKELISNLMVTEVSAGPYTWDQAIGYCDKLGKAGGAVPSPIPVIGGATYTDWRLPTQKELMQFYNAGIRGLNQTSTMSTNFGSVDNSFWSASSFSYDTTLAWNVYLNSGSVDNNSRAKWAPHKVVCVR